VTKKLIQNPSYRKGKETVEKKKWYVTLAGKEKLNLSGDLLDMNLVVRSKRS